MRGLAGKVALVSGGTKASGEAISTLLARRGASVVVSGRGVAEGEAVAERIRATGGGATFVAADITVEAHVAAAVNAAMGTFGRLDIVVNNAAAIDVVRSGADAPVTEASTGVVEAIMAVGFYGPLWFFKHAIPAMLVTGGGTFVSVSSTSAAIACPGIPAYSASKAALEALSRQVCADYGRQGIRSNVVRLGSMAVPGNAAVHADPSFAAASRAQVLVPRLATPDDLAAAVAFLASPSSGFATGSVVSVDGGASVFNGTPNVTGTWSRHGPD